MVKTADQFFSELEIGKPRQMTEFKAIKYVLHRDVLRLLQFMNVD